VAFPTASNAQIEAIWRAGRLSQPQSSTFAAGSELVAQAGRWWLTGLRVARNALPLPMAAIRMASWASGS
jgi:hypothetical protein